MTLNKVTLDKMTFAEITHYITLDKMTRQNGYKPK